MSLKNRLDKIEDRLSVYTNKEVLFFDNKIGIDYAKRYNLSLDVTIEALQAQGYEILHFLGGELIHYVGESDT